MSQLAHAVPEGIGVNLEDLSRAFGAADFPSGLFQHRENMPPFDFFKRRMRLRVDVSWAAPGLTCAVHVPPARIGDGAGDRIEVGNLGRKEVELQH